MAASQNHLTNGVWDIGAAANSGHHYENILLGIGNMQLVQLQCGNIVVLALECIDDQNGLREHQTSKQVHIITTTSENTAN